MSERTADETITKLTRKAGAAHKVLKVDKNSVTVERDGVEDKVSKDRVTRAPARMDPKLCDLRTQKSKRKRSNVQRTRQSHRLGGANAIRLNSQRLPWKTTRKSTGWKSC